MRLSPLRRPRRSRRTIVQLSRLFRRERIYFRFSPDAGQSDEELARELPIRDRLEARRCIRLEGFSPTKCRRGGSKFGVYEGEDSTRYFEKEGYRATFSANVGQGCGIVRPPK